MPYTEKPYRDLVNQGTSNISTYGDLNYAITRVILAIWNAKPCYATVHEIRKAYVTDQKHNGFLNHLRSELASKFSVADIYTAAQEAYDEFRDRVVRPYEAKKCIENGDLEEYVEAITKCITELVEAKKAHEPKTASLILPGQETK